MRRLQAVVEERSKTEVARTAAIQKKVLDYVAAGHIKGFSGLALDIEKDIDLVAAHAKTLKPGDDYDTTSYLLSALVAIQTGNTNQATLNALRGIARP